MSKQSSKNFDLPGAIRKLEEIEQYFQQSTTNLEEALAKHKEAFQVAKEILEYLQVAENELEQLSLVREKGAELDDN